MNCATHIISNFKKIAKNIFKQQNEYDSIKKNIFITRSSDDQLTFNDESK